MKKGRRTGITPWLMSVAVWAKVRRPTDRYLITPPYDSDSASIQDIQTHTMD
jgi:hypothetical protein